MFFLPKKKKPRPFARLWNTETGELNTSALTEKWDPWGEVKYFWSPNGKLLVANSRSFGYLSIYNNRGEVLQEFENKHIHASFNQDGKLLATMGANNSTYIWQIEEK